MELLQLYYFQVTARYEHISAAARELHIAQPALSQTIQRLEREIGTPLFDRTGKHIRLNNFGRIFLKYTNTILGALSDAKTEINEALGSPHQKITLCIQAASSLLPDFLEKFRALHPKIPFQIIQSASAREEIPDIDLTIHSVPHSRPKTEENKDTRSGILTKQTPNPGKTLKMQESCVLLTEPLVIALPFAHPLAQKKALKLSELSCQPFATLHKSTDLFFITQYYCHMAGFEPKISLSCDNPQAFRELLGLNMGIALIPKLTWPNIESYGVVTRPICDLTCCRDILLSWNKNHYLSAGTLLFRDFIKDYFLSIANRLTASSD